MYDAAAEQQLMAISKHGNRLTCPGCGGEEFYIYRSNKIASVDDDDNNEMVVRHYRVTGFLLVNKINERKRGHKSVINNIYYSYLRMSEDKEKDNDNNAANTRKDLHTKKPVT